MEGRDEDEMVYRPAVGSLKATREYLTNYGHRKYVVLHVLGADSLGAAWRMRKILHEHAEGRNPPWEIRGGEQLNAAANLLGPVESARYSALVIVERLAGGFSFGPGFELAHGAMPLPHTEGRGPGGIGYGLFEQPHRYALGNGGHAHALARAFGYGGITGSIGRLLARRYADGMGMTFADAAEEVDAGGALDSLRETAMALRLTNCAALRGEALALANDMVQVRRRVLILEQDFSYVRYLSLRRSRRRCRGAWIAHFDDCFVSLQRDRVALVNLLHSLGTHTQRFLLGRIVFPRPHIL